ncbi:MAG TPA: hypothetical protein VJ654_03080 [Noviherbaspirillum sp.]|nr:hypothetical protein [Noviherbaspirillum sp.]
MTITVTNLTPAVAVKGNEAVKVEISPAVAVNGDVLVSLELLPLWKGEDGDVTPAAEAARDAAQTAATNAATSATDASASAAAAAGSATNAAASATNAAASASSATTDAATATTQAGLATASATAAATSATNAASSATDAAASATAAATSETNAATSATNAAASASSAATDAATATTKAGDAATAASAAGSSATSAATSATNAATSETNAAASATAASGSAATATAKASEAADSAAAAAASAAAASAGQINSDWDATSGVEQILNKPTLATVATSGAYTDLSGKPTIPASGADIGLGNVENKSSATIRSEITSTNVTTALGFTPVDATTVGAANGVAGLDSGGKVPAAQLPSYVDDVLEYATIGDFPATGETGKIYVRTNTNQTYRWSGSVYVEISASPGSTDAVTEGATNKYFTESRVLATVLAGLSTATNAAITAADTMLSAPGKLQKQITDLAAANTGDETTTSTGALINGATAKTTPVDADQIGLMDSAASNVLKKLSWANIKATLKTYFDTLYGNVIGQASSVDSEIALFSGTGGKTIKRATTTGVLKAASGVLAAATAGTDYVAPGTATTYTATQTFKGIGETVYNLASTDITIANGTIQYKTLSGNTTFTESLADGQAVTLMLNPATYTTTWPTITWISASGNAAPTLTASVYNVIVLWQISGVVYGNYKGHA